MCLGSNFCLCHLIQAAIEDDSEKLFKSNFLKKFLIVELYDFLKDSYIILNNDDSQLFRTNLIKLYDGYISETNLLTQPINIDYQVRFIFTSEYDKFVEGISNDEEGMREELMNLKKFIEKFAFKTLIDRDGFKDYLLKYSDKQQTVEMEQETEDESSCCNCKCIC